MKKSARPEGRARHKITLDIPEDWYKVIQAEAVKTDTTPSFIVKQLISVWLDEPVFKKLSAGPPVLENQLPLEGLDIANGTNETAGKASAVKRTDPVLVPRKRKRLSGMCGA